MADSQLTSTAATDSASAANGCCPFVAELIDYALGQLLGDDLSRVEFHLNQDGDCPCRRWVEKAKVTIAAVLPTSVSDPTPLPSSLHWQRHVLLDLQQRLVYLEQH